MQRSRGFDALPVKAGASQPEASLAGMVATPFLKRRQQVPKPPPRSLPSGEDRPPPREMEANQGAMTISRTLGDIARMAPTAVATESAIEALRCLAFDGDFQAVVELATVLDVHLEYETPPAAYRGAATIEELVASDALPALVRLYASGFVPRSAALNRELYAKLSKLAKDDHAYARFTCLLRHISPFENEILKAFLLFVFNVSLPSHPRDVIRIIGKIMVGARVVEGDNATASFEFGRILLMSGSLALFVGVAGHELGHNFPNDFKRIFRGDPDLRGVVEEAPLTEQLSDSDEPAERASAREPQAAMLELGAILPELKAAAMKPITQRALRSNEAAKRDTPSGLRVLFSFAELPDGFYHQISLSEDGGALPAVWGATCLYAVLHFLDLAPNRVALAYSPGGICHLAFMLSRNEFEAFRERPVRRLKMESKALARIGRKAKLWFRQLESSRLVATSERYLLELLGFPNYVNFACGRLDSLIKADVNLCRQLHTLHDIKSLGHGGVDLNAVLASAIRCADPLLVEKLVQAGAFLDIRSGNDHTPSLLAGYSLVVEVQNSIASYHGPTAGDVLRTCDVLFTAGLPVDVVLNEDGDTLLIDAASRSNTAVRFLLERGADVRRQNCRGEGAIYVAASAGNTKALAVLLGAELADIDSPTLEGVTPLMRAVETGLPEIVKLLLKHGADANAGTSLGKTALHFAVLSKHEASHSDMVRILLEADAAVDEQTNDGVTPLLQVLDRYTEHYQFTRKYMKGIPVEKDLYWELLVRQLLQAGADPTHSDVDGRSALSLVTKLRKQDHIRQLVEQAAKA
jgi:ankyrin repeat protein